MASNPQVKPTLKVEPQRPAAAPSTSPASLPYLQEGSTFRVVVGNVDRLARSGLSLREATQLALQRAGLQRFPKSTDRTSPTSPPASAPTGTPARTGGVGIEAENAAEMCGELENLLGLLNRHGGVVRKGPRAGQKLPKEFRRSGGLPGIPGIIVRKGGLTLDNMRKAIQKDPRWANKFDSLSGFLAAVSDAIRVEVGVMAPKGASAYSVEDILENVFDVRPGGDWWRTPPVNLLDESTVGDANLETPAGDTSLSITDFDGGLFDRTDDNPDLPADRLTTGERQLRFPSDLGAVRDQEVAHPEIADVPFALTPPPVKPARAGREEPSLSEE